MQAEGGKIIDISTYQGIGQFGQAYKVMYGNDTHAQGSVDLVLADNMTKLCPETVVYLYSRYTPQTVLYSKGSRLELERILTDILQGCNSNKDRIESIAVFTSGLGERSEDDIDSMLFGGTEEEIISRGSEWCTDVARVGCILFQVAGLASRIIHLADTDKAYHGHVITEVYSAGLWGAVDAVTGVIYRHSNGKPASTWELMNNPDLVILHYKDVSTYYANPGQFRAGAVSNYFVSDQQDYNYTVSRVNNYKRSVLKISEKGWPEGLRWLHGEEEDN